MPVALEQSKSAETESTEAPVQVTSNNLFSNFIRGKTIKNIVWDDKYNGWLVLHFTDKSKLVISDNCLIPNGVNLRYVPAPKKS